MIAKFLKAQNALKLNNSTNIRCLLQIISKPESLVNHQNRNFTNAPLKSKLNTDKHINSLLFSNKSNLRFDSSLSEANKKPESKLKQNFVNLKRLF